MARPIVQSRTVTKAGKTMGRPRLNPPADAATRIEELAAEGHGVVGVARQLGVSPDTLRRWFDDDSALKEAFEFGREAERFYLHSLLRKQAEKGNVIAGLFLLKARHGYIEGDQGEQANRVQITFNLPGALKPEQFVVEQSNVRSSEDLALPGTRAVRS